MTGQCSGGLFLHALPAATATACSDECFADKQCKFYSFERDTGVCSMVSSRIDFNSESLRRLIT